MLRERARTALRKAVEYDRDMHPAWARAFEPPSVTGGEAQSVMKGLLLLFRETGKRKYLEPLSTALPYYRRSLLSGALSAYLASP